MNVTGIIAEYNPFHNGHAYHLNEARKQTNADFIFVVMGGNFMQRGEPAIVDKYMRTEMALQSGADLVIELPSAFATGSAEFFAEGAIELLDASQVVTHLCFGSEKGELTILNEAAELLQKESPAFSSALRSALSKGLSYPLAREKALLTALSLPENSDLFALPNNILAIEYLKALKKRNSSILPVTLQRKGSYHGTIPLESCNEFASASAIRKELLQNTASSIRNTMPQTSNELLSKATFRTLDDFSAVLHYRLLSAADPLEFSDYLDVSFDLSRRIFSLRQEFNGYDSFIDLVKTRQYTRTRIARALLHILLDIKKESVQLPKELRVLGFRKSASPLLGAIKKQSRLPLITKLPKDGSFDAEIRRSAFYHLGHPYEERLQQIIII